MPPRCIVIGASAGGLEPLMEVLAPLPAGFSTPVFVVMHVPADQESYLPGILSRASPLPAIHPQDNTRTVAGHVYVAPPDHHMLLDDGFIAVKKGPKENGFRPSIDALFRSAAYSYGPGVIGVVLSGALNDGTSGLWSIKRLGGTAIVQEPNGALYPSMPRSALQYIEADYRASPPQIGARLLQLAQQSLNGQQKLDPDAEEDANRMALETQIAAGITLPEKAILDLGELSPFTCPECKGVLVHITEGNLLRFRCHTGHGFTADTLLAALTETIDQLMWQSTRGLQEGSMLLEHMAQHIEHHGDRETAKTFQEKSREFNRKAAELRKIALGHEILSDEKLQQQEPSGERRHRPPTRPGA